MACHALGWRPLVIAFAAFLVNFLILGPLFNYSILFVSFKEQFDSSAMLTGWVGSLANGLCFLCCPLTSLLLKKFSCRTVILVGGVLYSAGLLTTSFVTALEYAYLTFGVLVGIGANFAIYGSYCLLLNWFRDRNFMRVSSTTLLGSSFGMLVFSPLLTNFIVFYGWRTALRILTCGILVTGIPGGLFLTKPPVHEDDSIKKKTPIEITTNSSGTEQVQKNETWNKVDELNATSRELEDERPNENSICIEDNNPTDDSQTVKHGVGILHMVTNIELDELNATTRELEDEKPNENSICIEDNNPTDDSQAVKHGVGILHMVTHIDPWAYCIASILALLGWTFFIVNLASFMDGLGLNKDQISFVIMFFAVGEIGGKILVAVVGHHYPIGILYTPFASSFLGTIALGVMTVARTFPQMMALSILSGLFRSGLYGTSNAVAAKLFNEYNTESVTMVALFPFGIGVLFSAPLSGGLFDATGNYVLSLIIIAAFFVCSAALFLLVPIRRLRPRCPCSSSQTNPVKL